METLNVLLGLERILYNITLRPCDEEIIKEAKELIQKQGERLADYESTGMNPQDIKDADACMQKLYNLPVSKISDAYDLLLAKDTGRLVVLPCKVGDTVYVIGERLCRACMIQEAYILDDKDVEYLVTFGCDDDCDGCPFNNWHQDPSGEYSCDGEYCNASIKKSQFGKTVFLTREEAERCLD